MYCRGSLDSVGIISFLQRPPAEDLPGLFSPRIEIDRPERASLARQSSRCEITMTPPSPAITGLDLVGRILSQEPGNHSFGYASPVQRHVHVIAGGHLIQRDLDARRCAAAVLRPHRTRNGLKYRDNARQKLRAAALL